MARPKKVAKAVDPLADVKQRIREAEKRQASVAREQVGMDAEAWERLASLVEAGHGRKGEVLRDALALGLRMMAGENNYGEWTPRHYGFPNDRIVQSPLTPLDAPNSLAEAVVISDGFGPPIVQPPSLRRKLEDGEVRLDDHSEGDEDEPDEP